MISLQPSISSATGAFSRSSQSTTPSQGTPVPTRVRTRGIPIRDDEPGPERKRTKIASTTDEALELLVSLVKDQQDGKARVRLSTVELAIQLLQQEYILRLSEHHFLMAIDFLASKTNAGIFITLGSSIRETWLCKNADIELMLILSDLHTCI
jgi:hypothetical protein